MPPDICASTESADVSWCGARQALVSHLITKTNPAAVQFFIKACELHGCLLPSPVVSLVAASSIYCDIDCGNMVLVQWAGPFGLCRRVRGMAHQNTQNLSGRAPAQGKAAGQYPNGKEAGAMPTWSKTGRAMKIEREDNNASFVREARMLDRQNYARNVQPTGQGFIAIERGSKAAAVRWQPPIKRRHSCGSQPAGRSGSARPVRQPPLGQRRRQCSCCRSGCR